MLLGKILKAYCKFCIFVFILYLFLTVTNKEPIEEAFRLSFITILIVSVTAGIIVFVEYDIEIVENEFETEPAPKVPKTNRKYNFDIPIGKDEDGKIQKLDFRDAGHTLIGGATRSGKSVFMTNLIINLLKVKPHYARLVFVDFKNGISFHKYIDTPHSLINEIIKSHSKFISLLDELIKEMEKRYDLILENDCENIKEYNNTGKILPYIFVIIDEIGEVILNCSKEDKDKIDKSLARLGQLSAGCGIHLIIGTQRPSKDIVTPNLKANMLTSICFKTKNVANSKIIIDVEGAEKLRGRGQFILSPSWGENIVLQGFLNSRDEIENAIKMAKADNFKPDKLILEDKLGDYENTEVERNYSNEVIDLVKVKAAIRIITSGEVAPTVENMKKHLKVGVAKANDILSQLEKLGIVSEKKSTNGREVLISNEEEAYSKLS